jgi:hypothetical protein
MGNTQGPERQPARQAACPRVEDHPLSTGTLRCHPKRLGAGWSWSGTAGHSSGSNAQTTTSRSFGNKLRAGTLIHCAAGLELAHDQGG